MKRACRRRSGLAAVLAASIVVLVPQGASATTYVSLQAPINAIDVGQDDFLGEPEPAVFNDITVSLSGSNFLVDDPGGVALRSVPENACVLVSPTQASCPAATVRNLQGHLGGGDDRISLLDPVGRFQAFSLEEGNDSYLGSAGADRVDGGPGDDQIGLGAGDDTQTFGGDGSDQIDAGPGDDDAWGDDGSDAVDGGDGADHVSGGLGNDTLAGGAGNDNVDNPSAQGPEADGDDTLLGGDGDDELFGGNGDDVGDGGPGSDMIFAVAGSDAFAGGTGNDLMSARSEQPAILDGGDGDDQMDSWLNGPIPDRITCGPGADSINFGGSDIVDSDCETVLEVIGCQTTKCLGEIVVFVPAQAAKTREARLRRAGKREPTVLGTAKFKVRQGGVEFVEIGLAQAKVRKLFRNRTTVRVTERFSFEGTPDESPLTPRLQRTKTKFVLTK